MDLQLDGKRAYVMAASSGLGRAVAEELVREGASVVISSPAVNYITGAVLPVDGGWHRHAF
ncbi:3-oxoacyl-[acyl-carrier protein] reductase [Haladaptatus litoreus]|uniref:3-oxoacyl-[acyl-carrier protein] reductase n=1 Tax=Haladaptatus litoreus TaxID=553468 RepID=A0A1N7DZU1_9EURY|nr:3-oxoacyl-[acyl-carrier protein] reductase [Haladaptatus litoreus]